MTQDLLYDMRDYPPNDPFWTEPAELTIVRCKNCKYAEECIPPCEDRYCIKYDQRHPEYWFCADGDNS